MHEISASATNGLSLYVNNNANGIFLNGTENTIKVNTPKVTAADAIIASNGVVHVIDKVIKAQTIVDLAASNPAFTTLVSLAVKVKLVNLTGAPGALQGAGPFTVFAPANSAFTALDTELKAGTIFPLGLADPGLTDGVITNILTYHVVSGNILKADVTNTMVQPLLASKKFMTTKTGTGSVEIKDSANRTSKVVATDIQGTNGVIHVLDTVLLPL